MGYLFVLCFFIFGFSKTIDRPLIRDRNQPAVLTEKCTPWVNPIKARDWFLAEFKGSNINGMDKRIYHCPEDFMRIGNSCYFLSKYMDTWHGAQFICKDRKSQLATPNKKWKDRKLRRLLNNNMAAPLERWIGGIWNWEEKLWIWGDTGRKLKYQGFSRRSTENNDWHCIAMDPTVLYRWKSESCLLRKHFICEVPLRNIGKKPNDIYKKKRRKLQRERRKQQRRRNKESNDI